jgi:hypothetical protein
VCPLEILYHDKERSRLKNAYEILPESSVAMPLSI